MQPESDHKRPRSPRFEPRQPRPPECRCATIWRPSLCHPTELHGTSSRLARARSQIEPEIGRPGDPSKPTDLGHCNKGIPKWFLGPSGFWEAGVTKAKNNTCSGNGWCFWNCRRRRQCQKTTRFRKMFGLLAFVPQASKKTLGPNNTSGSL